MAGTEEGVKEPEATFSACFGAAFMMWHPYKYASLLAEKMQKHNATAWLVNTGWTAGEEGRGREEGRGGGGEGAERVRGGWDEHASGLPRPAASSGFAGNVAWATA